MVPDEELHRFHNREARGFGVHLCGHVRLGGGLPPLLADLMRPVATDDPDRQRIVADRLRAMLR